MRKIVFAVLVPLCACNLFKPKSEATDEGGTVAATSATSGGGGGVVAKGLSFLTGGPMQGELDFSIKNEKGENGTVNMLVKGTKQRMEMMMGGKNNAVIMDGDKKEMIMLDEDKKTAMIMKLDSEGMPGTPGGPGGGSHTSSGSGSPPKNDCVPNGKSDTVAGYDCNICVSDEADAKTEACVANGLSFLGFGGKSGLGALTGKVAGFPLRAVKTRKSDNKEVERFEVTKIERKNVGDDKFQVPAGYKTIDMAEMFKGLGGPPPHH